jgi:acyl-homoserine-lactone acylase
MKIHSLLLLTFFPIYIKCQTSAELSYWSDLSKKVTITRDIWYVPHISGKTDEAAVFGLIYAQCEDDFNRIEQNYIEKLGKKSEIEGKSKLFDDLMNRILLDHDAAIQDFKKAKPWLKKLLMAHAAGINYYLYKHPEVKPKLLKKFEPWYALLWTDGSIGAISTADINIRDLQKLYGTKEDQGIGLVVPDRGSIETGSNGFAIAPSLSKSGNALLFINPHTTFYFRSEVHLQSEEGLNVYGAATWGQFFIYQGFNEYCGWMHTSSNADVADVYFETTQGALEDLQYKYENKWNACKYKTYSISDGNEIKIFKVPFTTSGPIMKYKDNRYFALKEFNRSMIGLEQSWLRMKSKSYEEYQKVMKLRANTSNNTVFADNKGNIAYWHGNYMPKRDPTLNWSKPQDGSLKNKQYKGLHTLDQMIQILNPKSGWIQNCNSTPYTCCGESSPSGKHYAAYMAPDGENFRGKRAVELLEKTDKLDQNNLIQLAYDRKLVAFDVLIPSLSRLKTSIKDAKYAEICDTLINWDRYASSTSIATHIAVEWAQRLSPEIRKVYIDEGELDQVNKTIIFAKDAHQDTLFHALKNAVSDIENRFGTWKTPWGEANRYQRISQFDSYHDDSKSSFPVPYASALWGCLPSYNSRQFTDTKKRYGFSGNSFVAVVEFGPKVNAQTLMVGGNSGNPLMPHFDIQGEMYTMGKFKKLIFTREEIERNTFKKYKP